MKAGYLTLGCRVNQYETEAIAEGLASLGIETAKFEEKCDVYVINTCAVTEESVRKSGQMIRRAIKKNPSAFVAVTGCAAQLEGQELSEICGVRYVCGTRNKLSIVREVGKWLESGEYPENKLSVPEPTGEIEKTSITRFDRTRAYVKIEDGCDGKCAYCVITKVRGDVAVRDADDIEREVRTLAAGGCHEVVLTGIETAAYGKGLAELIKRIDAIDGIERIRLGSMEPSFMKPEFIDSVKDVPSLCHHFHLSVQNGSDPVLRRMRRKYNAEMLQRNIDYIRKIFPDVMFSADIIVGFPGETEEDFRRTCEFADRNGFLHLHVFTYSKRPGTEAAEMPDQIPEKLKTERLHKLEAIASCRKHEIFDALIESGEPLYVLAENTVNGYIAGHTGNFVECGIITDTPDCTRYRGKILKVRPVSTDGDLLVCEMI